MASKSGVGANKPKAIILDVLGSVVPLDGVRSAMMNLGLAKEQADVWYYLCHRDGIMTTLTPPGRFVPFKDIAGYHLQVILQGAGIPCSNESTNDFWSKLTGTDPYPDLGPGVTKLTEVGIATTCLTNGEKGAALAAYERAGVAGLVDPTLQLQVSDAGAWKPDPRSYAYAARVLEERLGASRGELMMVSRHVWDVHGAKLAGLQAAFLAREQEPYPAWLEQPDVVTTSLAHLADALAKRT